MPRQKQEGSKVDLVRKFLEKNPGGTFKDFDAEQPDVLTSAYFATMKSQIKKKAAGGGAVEKTPPPKRGRPAKAAKVATKASNGHSDLEAKIQDQKEFLAWVEDGMAKGYVDKLKIHLQ